MQLHFDIDLTLHHFYHTKVTITNVCLSPCEINYKIIGPHVQTKDMENELRELATNVFIQMLF